MHHEDDGEEEQDDGSFPGPPSCTTSPRAVLTRAMLLLRRGDWAEAERITRKVLCGNDGEEESPKQPRELDDGEEGKHEEMRKKPSSPENRGKREEAEGQQPAAGTAEEASGNRSAESDEEAEFGHFPDVDMGTEARLTWVLATSLKEQGRFDEAEQRARHGLQCICPRDSRGPIEDTIGAQLLNLLCLCLEAQDRYEEAIQAAQEGLATYYQAASAARAALHIRVASNFERLEAWAEAEEAALEGLEITEAVDVATQAALWTIVANARWRQKRHRDSMRARWAAWTAHMHHLVQRSLICDACVCRDDGPGEIPPAQRREQHEQQEH